MPWGLFSSCGEQGLLFRCCAGFSLRWLLLSQSRGCRHAGSVVVAHRLICSLGYGIFLDQGSNLCLLHWQADSLPLSHQGSPTSTFFRRLRVLFMPPACRVGEFGFWSQPTRCCILNILLVCFVQWTQEQQTPPWVFVWELSTIIQLEGLVHCLHVKSTGYVWAIVLVIMKAYYSFWEWNPGTQNNRHLGDT